MQNKKSETLDKGDAVSPLALGLSLRKFLMEEKRENGRSYRHMSLRVGRRHGYVASYVAQDPKRWALPKYPVLGRLLAVIGKTEEDLVEDALSGTAGQPISDEAQENHETPKKKCA